LTADGEQRAHARRALELPVLVDRMGNRVRGAVRLDVRDLSLGGAFVRCDLLFEEGELLDLTFALPGGGSIQACGRVVRVARVPSEEEAGMGVAFEQLAEADRATLGALLSGASGEPGN
jgi:hypothetical protein